MPAPVGATVTFRMTWDDEIALEEGLYLPIVNARDEVTTAFLVTHVRPMTRSPLPNRYEVQCMKIEPDDVPPGGPFVVCVWSRRDRRRPR
jgi:hypothetical protein